MEHRRREGRLLFPVKTGAIRCNCSIRRGITGEGRERRGREGRVEISQFHPSEFNPFGRNNKAAFLKVSTAHRCLNFLRNLGY